MASQAEVSLVNEHLHVSGTYRKWGRGPQADSHLRFHKSGWELTVLRLHGMSLSLNQFDCKYVTCIWNHETTYPAVMFDMSGVGVCTMHVIV